MRVIASFVCDPELLAEIDEVRKDLPRSRFVVRALRHYLEKLKHEAVQTTQAEQQVVDVY